MSRCIRINWLCMAMFDLSVVTGRMRYRGGEEVEEDKYRQMEKAIDTAFEEAAEDYLLLGQRLLYHLGQIGVVGEGMSCRLRQKGAEE